jgi:hypothetical protein
MNGEAPRRRRGGRGRNKHRDGEATGASSATAANAAQDAASRHNASAQAPPRARTHHADRDAG